MSREVDEKYQIDEEMTVALQAISSNWAETDMTMSGELPIAVFPRYLGGKKRFELNYPGVSGGNVCIALNEGQLRSLAARIAVTLARHDQETDESMEWREG